MVSRNISVYTILFKTANQAVLLIKYNFYGCPVNYFWLVLIYTNSYICRSDFRSNSEDRKNQRRKKECSEYFLILKPKYVEDLTLYLSD
jgi:hypothetical protein